MSYSFFRRLVLPVLLTASLLVPSAASISSAAATPDAYHDDWLHVNDNAEIVDRDGNPVWITGCNWFGYNVVRRRLVAEYARHAAPDRRPWIQLSACPHVH